MKKQNLLTTFPKKLLIPTGIFETIDERADCFIVNRKKFYFLELFELEKERRGVKSLVFTGMANIAKDYCDQQTLYRNQENEYGFFMAYLEDRLKYLVGLSSIDDKFLFDKKSILEVGEEITLAEVNLLLKQKEKIESSNEENDSKERKRLEKRLIRLGKNKPKQEYNFERGRISQQLFSEKYPSIRWNFIWKDYVVNGIPDGITDDLVYEYKSTKKRTSFPFVKREAFAQADLYGYFFQRPKKIVHIRVEEEGKIEKFEEDVDVKNAEKVLQEFYDLDHKLRNVKTPYKQRACGNCDYKKICEVYPTLTN